MNVLERKTTERRTTVRSAALGIASGATLLPRGVAAAVAALGGRTDTATRLLRDRLPDTRGEWRHLRLHERHRALWCAVATILLGLVTLVLVGVEGLYLARGVLYGLVVDGPYDTSWGGPTRAGAWAAHFAIATPLAAVGLWLLYLLAHLHRRLVGRICGLRTGAWVIPTALLTGAAGVLFVVAFLHQL